MPIDMSVEEIRERFLHLDMRHAAEMTEFIASRPDLGEFGSNRINDPRGFIDEIKAELHEIFGLSDYEARGLALIDQELSGFDDQPNSKEMQSLYFGGKCKVLGADEMITPLQFMGRLAVVLPYVSSEARDFFEAICESFLGMAQKNGLHRLSA